MIAFRAYLLRLTVCAFLVAMLSAFVTQPRIRRIVQLCGGCLLMLAALNPLRLLDLSSLQQTFRGFDGTVQEQLSSAKQKNDKLLEDMIRDRTLKEIETEAAAQGLSLELSLTLRWDDALGMPVPWEITLRGSVDARERERFSAYLEAQLQLPPERQVWQTQ